MSFLTEEEKEFVHGVFDELHETFARDIVVFYNEDSVFVDTNNGHNPIYGPPSRSMPREPDLKKITKKARIKYLSDQSESENLLANVSFPKGYIRLKVDQETYSLITKAKKILIDDILTELASPPSRPGPFSPNYWTIFLKKVD